MPKYHTDVTLLQIYIKQSGLSIAALAKKASISRSTLYAVLHGDDITIRVLEKLRHALGLSPEETIRIFFAYEITHQVT